MFDVGLGRRLERCVSGTLQVDDMTSMGRTLTSPESQDTTDERLPDVESEQATPTEDVTCSERRRRVYELADLGDLLTHVVGGGELLLLEGGGRRLEEDNTMAKVQASRTVCSKEMVART
jgi:hypothetical protein